MNWQASAGTDAVRPVVGEPEVVCRTATAEGGGEDWLCAWCHNRVANESDRFEYEGRSEFSFSNPERIRFQIITFSRTLGCRQTGVPTLANTWFPGHAWSYCQCDRCGMHLGWFYAGQHQFAGLIKIRLVRGVWARN